MATTAASSPTDPAMSTVLATPRNDPVMVPSTRTVPCVATSTSPSRVPEMMTDDAAMTRSPEIVPSILAVVAAT